MTVLFGTTVPTTRAKRLELAHALEQLVRDRMPEDRGHVRLEYSDFRGRQINHPGIDPKSEGRGVDEYRMFVGRGYSLRMAATPETTLLEGMIPRGVRPTLDQERPPFSVL